MKKLHCLLPACLAITLIASSTQALCESPQNAGKMQRKLASRGVGARVRITRDDQTEITGLVRSIDPTGVVIVSNSAPDPTLVPYETIAAIHSAHSDKGTKVGFGIGLFLISVAVAGVVALAVLIATSHTSL